MRQVGGGSGWIFGAKHLKAIVAVGTEPVEVAHPKLFQRKVKELVWRLNSSEAMAGLIRGGTHGMAAAGGVFWACTHRRQKYSG